jgi:hypothetical protein
MEIDTRVDGPWDDTQVMDTVVKTNQLETPSRGLLRAAVPSHGLPRRLLRLVPPPAPIPSVADSMENTLLASGSLWANRSEPLPGDQVRSVGPLGAEARIQSFI